MIKKQFTMGGLSASESETKVFPSFPLKLDIQFFAEKEEDEDDPGEDDEDDDEEDEDDVPDLEELLKNPKFKAAHEERLQKQLNRRLKKFKDVDPDEYRRLKAEADKKGNKKTDNDDEGNEEEKERSKKLDKAETKLKTAAIKVFAVEKEVDPILLAKFIDAKEVDLDEDGEPENLDDLFDDLMESKYARYFATADEDQDDEEDAPKKKKGTTYTGGRKQKMNKQNKLSPAELGRQKALERHPRKE